MGHGSFDDGFLGRNLSLDVCIFTICIRDAYTLSSHLKKLWSFSDPPPLFETPEHSLL